MKLKLEGHNFEYEGNNKDILKAHIEAYIEIYNKIYK